jgi:hypothetical protein
MLKRCLHLRQRCDQAQVIAQDFDLVMEQMVANLASPQRGWLPATTNTGWNRRRNLAEAWWDNV